MADNKFNAMAPAQFNHEMFGTVRVLKSEGGEIWFVAKDVAVALGYKNRSKAVHDHCKRKGVTNCYTLGGQQAVTIIPEADVYRLIIRSKLPTAEQFEEWVMEEVLPSIRKTGTYIDKRVASPAFLREMADVIEKKDRELAEARPSIAFHERCTHKKTLWTISMAAKELGVTLSHLQVVLLRNGVLQQRGKRYWPREGYIHKGYFEVIPECNYGFTPGGLELARDLIKGNHKGAA
jgi:prophage antirepressor-like protein